MNIFFILFYIFTIGNNDILKINLINEIPLGEININQVEYVDVSQDGDLLLTDLSRQSVVLFEAETESFRELDPEECHPGYAFHPIRAQFVSSEIWVFNQQSEVFRFQRNGDCSGPMSKRMSAPDLFSEINKGEKVGLKPLRFNLQEPTLYFYNNLGVEKDRIEAREIILAPIFSIRYGSGGMFAKQDKIYFALSSAPVIYSYDTLDESFERFLPEETMKLSIVENDDIERNSRGNSGLILNEVRDYLSNYTSTIHFGRLNHKYALLHIEQPGRSGRELLVFDLDKNQFLNQSYTLDVDSNEFYYAFGNSKAYNITFRDQEDRWVLEIYEVEIQL